jgi:hypothetical protein
MAGMCAVSAYFSATNVAEVMLQIFSPSLHLAVVYWMVGVQSSAGQFFIFLGFMELGMFTANSVALRFRPHRARLCWSRRCCQWP